MNRDNHYEAAFEAFLRARRLPYIAIDEARRSVVAGGSLKSLDFIVSPPGQTSWLVDVKGYRAWAKPFAVYGMNAITVFVLTGLIGRITLQVRVGMADGKPVFLKAWLFEHLKGAFEQFGGDLQDLCPRIEADRADLGQVRAGDDSFQRREVDRRLFEPA